MLRGEAGFCREEWMSWCEANGVDDVFGLARNERLRRSIEEARQEAGPKQQQTGQAARVCTEFE